MQRTVYVEERNKIQRRTKNIQNNALYGWRFYAFPYIEDQQAKCCQQAKKSYYGAGRIGDRMSRHGIPGDDSAPCKQAIASQCADGGNGDGKYACFHLAVRLCGFAEDTVEEAADQHGCPQKGQDKR